MLTVLDTIPVGILHREAHQLHEVLTGPTLIHLAGEREPALFISVLLHGNEDTSWIALRKLLLRYHHQPLPRSLSIFIGNIAAARHEVRHLPDQPDYNRIWKGGLLPEEQMTKEIIEQMRQKGVFASVDIHNNTGRNPHYACVNRVDDPRYLHLATLFSRTVVYFTQPDTVQSLAFAQLCPSVALECGKVGTSSGVERALDFLEVLLHLEILPSTPVTPIDLFHTVAVVKIPPHISYGFGDLEKDICFLPDLDQFNFQELPADSLIGWSNQPETLDCRDSQGKEVSARYFRWVNRELRTALPFMPSMLTLNTQVIRQDCLCYLMERYFI